MADHTKFGHSSPITFMEYARLDAVVTDQKPEQAFIEAAEKNNIRILWDES